MSTILKAFEKCRRDRSGQDDSRLLAGHAAFWDSCPSLEYARLEEQLTVATGAATLMLCGALVGAGAGGIVRDGMLSPAAARARAAVAGLADAVSLPQLDGLRRLAELKLPWSETRGAKPQLEPEQVPARRVEVKPGAPAVPRDAQAKREAKPAPGDRSVEVPVPAPPVKATNDAPMLQKVTQPAPAPEAAARNAALAAPLSVPAASRTPPPVVPVLPVVALAPKAPLNAGAVAPAPKAAPRAVRHHVTLPGGMSVTVSDEQRATLKGSATSLRDAVEELCRQAKIELLSYKAPERAYNGGLEDVPVTEALRSMLRSESYLLGVHTDDSTGRRRVTWLQVVGARGNGLPAPIVATPKTPARISRAALARRTPDDEEPYTMAAPALFSAFGNSDPGIREDAQTELLSQLTDPDERERFVRAPSEQIANLFANYMYAGEAVRRMSILADSADLRDKLDEVLSFMHGPSDEG